MIRGTLTLSSKVARGGVWNVKELEYEAQVEIPPQSADLDKIDSIHYLKSDLKFQG